MKTSSVCCVVIVMFNSNANSYSYHIITVSFQFQKSEFCILVIPKNEEVTNVMHVFESIISFPHDHHMEGLKEHWL